MQLVFSECKALVASLTKVDVIHCFREANSVADSLAKYSLSNRSSEVWDSSIPDFISHLIVHDLSIISILIKNRVGDDGVPAILQYRPSDLYLTDRKKTMIILQKDTHTPLHICR